MKITTPIALAIVTFTLSIGSVPVFATAVPWPASSGGNDHWYEPVPVSEGLNWLDANAAAQARGGYLVDILSPKENAFVFGLIDAPEYWINLSGDLVLADGPWIGAYQADASDEPGGNFIWSHNGSAVSFVNWHSGEPNDFGGEEDHVRFFTFGSHERSAFWNDSFGQNIGAYIIEYDSNPDRDGDGVPNSEDPCPDSDSAETVMIDGCESGVANVFVTAACTISDLIAECAATAANHDEFVSCVAHLTNHLKKDDLIFQREKGTIQSCAAQSSLP